MRHAPDATAQRSADPRLINLVGALATGLTDAALDAITAVTGLDAAASTTLIALLDFLPGGSVRTLSLAVGLTHSGAVRLVDRLVDAGLVTRGTGDDARSRAITLTPAGRRLARRVRSAREAAITGVMDDVPEHERALLTEVCERWISRITRQRLEQRAGDVTPAGGALCRLCDFAACGRPEGVCPAATTAAAASS